MEENVYVNSVDAGITPKQKHDNFQAYDNVGYTKI
jgi:hypothetical protein